MTADVLAGLQTVERRLALFMLSMLECSWSGDDVTGADIQEEALRLQLIERTAFDPAVHDMDEGYPLERGADYYVIPSDVRAVLDGNGSSTDQSNKETL